MGTAKGNLNIITLGRSGAGKSSLLNYLLNKEHFKTGVGRPVTGAGFYDTQHKIAGVPVTVIDSYGIESGANFLEWKKLLQEKLKQHDYSHNIEEWLHVVMYCISAEDARVQPIDWQIIKNFTSTGQKMIIVITHADEGEETCKALRDEICAKIPDIDEKYFVEIDSVKYKKQYLGNDLRNMIIEQYLDNVFFALPKYCIQKALAEIDDFQWDINYDIDHREYGIFDSDSEHVDWLRKKCQAFRNTFARKKIPSIISSAVKESVDLAQNLGAILDNAVASADNEVNFSFRNKFKYNDSAQLWNDNDPLVDKIGLFALATLFSPVIIAEKICELFTHDTLKANLCSASENYCNNLKKIIEDSEDKFTKVFDSIKNAVLISEK